MKVSDWSQESPRLARGARFERDVDHAPKNIVLTRDDGAKLVFKSDGIVEASLLAKNIIQAATTGPKGSLNTRAVRQRDTRALRELQQTIAQALARLEG